MSDYKKSQVVGVSTAISLMVAWVSLESLGIFDSLYGYVWYTMDLSQWIGMIIFSIGTGIILVSALTGMISLPDAYEAQSELIETMSGMSEDEVEELIENKAKNLVRFIEIGGQSVLSPTELLMEMQNYYADVSSGAKSSVFCVSEQKTFLSKETIAIIPAQSAATNHLQTIKEFRKNTWKQAGLILALGVIVLVITQILKYVA